MDIITCLILNRPYNISQMIFNHMLDNIKGERFLQYPRFVQMLLDDQIPNLPKANDDKLDHMDNETLKRLDVYRGVEKGKKPELRRKFAAIEKLDYQALADDKWRHDNSDSETETEKMKLFDLKKTKWWVKPHGKKKKKTPSTRTPKATTPKAAPKRAPKKRKSPPHQIDEPNEVPLENVNVEGDDVEMTVDEFENIATAQDARNAEIAGGVKSGKNIEAVKETQVEGEMYTDSGEIESDIDLTQIAPTTAVSGKIRLKGPSRKKRDSDEEDATYVPSEVEKITKGQRKDEVKSSTYG
ncbi:hypothetical protein HanRHA438_Chr17g0818921 [Helianthus annuus]|nr:hypothetical protein HanRHA438_Chr17g0818921 [Helianthus annuus]